MSSLPVPGARLSYETRGSGPVLVLIPGANGDARVFAGVGDYLAEHYTVVTYDRRGFSRSLLTGPQDYDHRLETDADDVRRLIEHLGHARAAVFGTSSGAVVALAILTRYPSAVRALAAYEPATVALLPDGQSWMDFIGRLYELYRSAERIVLLTGADSRGYPAYQVNVELGRILGRDIVETPGGHVAAGSHPAEFARTLHHALSTCQVHAPPPGPDQHKERR